MATIAMPPSHAAPIPAEASRKGSAQQDATPKAAAMPAKVNAPASIPLGRFCIGIGSLCGVRGRSEEHTSELQSLMRISYAVFCLKKKNRINLMIFTQWKVTQHMSLTRQRDRHNNINT